MKKLDCIPPFLAMPKLERAPLWSSGLTKKFRFVAMLLLVLCNIGTAHAQWQYVADNIYGDSVRVFERQVNDKANNNDPCFAFKAGKTVFRVANGDTLLIAREDSGIVASNYTIHEEPGYKESWVPGAGNTEYEGFATVTIEGRKYLVRQSDLMLAEGGGESDWVNAKGGNHSDLAHWYGGYTPYWLILLFLVLAMLVPLLADISQFFVVLTPLFLLAAIVLEGLGIKALGSEVLWILDMKQLGIGTAIWHGFLLLIASLLQFFSLRVMAGSGDSELNYKLPLICTLVGLAITIVMVMIDGLFIHDGKWSITIGLLLSLVLIVIGVAKSLMDNSRELGFVGGLVFTLFVVIWTIGILVLAVVMIMGLITYFLDMLLFFAAFGIALGLSNALIPFTTFVKDGVLYEVYRR